MLLFTWEFMCFTSYTYREARPPLLFIVVHFFFNLIRKLGVGILSRGIIYKIISIVFKGIPEQAEAPPVARPPASAPAAAASPPAQSQQSAAPAAPSSGPNANPLDLFPQVVYYLISSINYLISSLVILSSLISFWKQGLPSLGSNPAGAGTLDFLRNSQQVQFASPLFSLSHAHTYPHIGSITVSHMCMCAHKNIC